jgi:hypothetical protein
VARRRRRGSRRGVAAKDSRGGAAAPPPALRPFGIPAERRDDLGRARVLGLRLPERALQRGRQPSRPAAESRGDLGSAAAPVRRVDHAAAATTERIADRVVDPPDRRVQRRRRAEEARLERRVEDVVAVAARRRELRERVDLGVREPRAREALPRRIEDPVPAAGDDLAVRPGDDRADGNRAGEVCLPRQLERRPPGLLELAPRIHSAIVERRSHAVHDLVDLRRKLPLGASVSVHSPPSDAPANMLNSPANGQKRPVHNGLTPRG